MAIMKPTSNIGVQATEQIQLQDDDFTAAPAEGETIQSGETKEVFRAEVGEDGVLASYDALQLGGTTGPNPKSARGKIYVDIRDTNGNSISKTVEFRFVGRPRNENSRRALTPFYTLRDLDNDNPELRQALPPATNSRGQPTVVQNGRVIAVEIRTSGETAEVSLSESTIEVPAIAGY